WDHIGCVTIRSELRGLRARLNKHCERVHGRETYRGIAPGAFPSVLGATLVSNTPALRAKLESGVLYFPITVRLKVETVWTTVKIFEGFVDEAPCDIKTLFFVEERFRRAISKHIGDVFIFTAGICGAANRRVR